MSWQRYLIPVIASSFLMISCWCVGYFGFSSFWIFVFVVLYVLKTHMWIQREQERLLMTYIILRERDTIISQFGGQLKDLPAWVQFPDTERIESLNKILHQLWPYIGVYAKHFLHEFIEPQIKAQMPRPFKNFKFLEIDCGDLPCRIGGLKVYTENVGRDKIIIDMDVVYAGDAQFSVKVCGFEGGINEVVLSGKIRCILQPLIAYPPMVGGISGAFIEIPKFDFNLTGMGEFVQLPGLINAIRSIISAQAANLCVLPNTIVVPLVPDVDVTKLYFPEPDGVVRIKVIEARNLENKDASMLLRHDKSDPFCEVQVGAQLFKTLTVNNNLNPVFNECFEAVVDYASGQILRVVVFDEDTTSANEELGRLSVPLDVVRKDGKVDRWYHLEGCKHGEIHLKISWLDLSLNYENIMREKWENEWLSADKPIHPALLMVFIDNISDLPYPKSNLEPSPFVEVSLSQIVQRTPVKVKTINPLYQTKFLFFVKHPEGQELKLKAVDDGTRRELGNLTIKLIDLISQPKMEIFQQTFSLQHGVHTSRIVMTIRLRTFVTPKASAIDVASGYGSGSHIERAERYRNNNHVILTNQNQTYNLWQKSKIEDQKLNANNTNDTNFVTSGNTVETYDIQLPKTCYNNSYFPSLKRNNSFISNVSVPFTKGSTASSLAGFRDTSNNNTILNCIKSVSSKPIKRMSKRSSISVYRGQLKYGLYYNKESFKLFVEINCAKNLVPVEKNHHANPYVSIKLVPLDASFPSKGKRRTEVVEDSVNPEFNAQLYFDVHFTELQNYRLRIIVKDAINYGMLCKPPILGQAEILLDKFNPYMKISGQWINL